MMSRFAYDCCIELQDFEGNQTSDFLAREFFPQFPFGSKPVISITYSRTKPPFLECLKRKHTVF